MGFYDTALGRRVARIPANLRGMTAMLGSAMTISGMNGVVHHLAGTIHVFEIAFFRQLFGLIFMSLLFLRGGLYPLYTRRIWMHVLRASLNIIALLTYFVALSLEPLAKVVGLTFTAPMFATLGAVVFLGERLNRQRLVALGISVVGALIILRPGVEVVSFGMMMVIVSNTAWGAALVVIKVLARTESAVTISMYAALLMVPASLPFALYAWQWPTLEILSWMIIIGIGGSFAQLCLSQAFREADATMVLPVDFTKLIFASSIGYFFFAEIPGIWTIIGAVVIFSGVFYNAYYERAAAP